MTLFINSSFIGNQYLGCLRMALSSAQFWFTLILTLGILLIPMIAIRFYTFNLYPTLSDKVRLKQRLTRFKSAVKSQLPPMYARRKSSIRRSRRSVRSAYAFSHQEGFGTLIMSGKLAQKPSITRYNNGGFNTIGESLTNSLSSNAAPGTFSNTSLHVPKVGVVPITGVAAMGNLVLASAGGLPTVDRDNLLMEQPIKTTAITNRPKLTVVGSGSLGSETPISLDSRSSKQSRKSLSKLKNTHHSTSLSNQSVHSVQSNPSVHSTHTNELSSSRTKLGSKQSTIDRTHSNELKQQSSEENNKSNSNRSVASNHTHEESQHSSHRNAVPNKELDKENDVSNHDTKSASRHTLSRQSTNQSHDSNHSDNVHSDNVHSDNVHSDNVHSDSSLTHATKNLKSLTNSKAGIRNGRSTEPTDKKSVSKSIENLSAGRNKAMTAEQRRSRLQSQLSQPSSSAKLNSKSHKLKQGPSSIEI